MGGSLPEGDKGSAYKDLPKNNMAFPAFKIFNEACCRALVIQAFKSPHNRFKIILEFFGGSGISEVFFRQLTGESAQFPGQLRPVGQNDNPVAEADGFGDIMGHKDGAFMLFS